jgi:hypothetical protein
MAETKKKEEGGMNGGTRYPTCICKGWFDWTKFRLLAITEMAHINRLLFPWNKLCINLTKHGFGYILGDSITNSSGHPDTLCNTYLGSQFTAIFAHLRENIDVFHKSQCYDPILAKTRKQNLNKNRPNFLPDFSSKILQNHNIGPRRSQMTSKK